MLVWHCKAPWGSLFSLLWAATNVISYEDLKALLGKSQNLLLVDVRSKEELDKGGIPGSVHIPGELNNFTKKKRIKVEKSFAWTLYFPLKTSLIHFQG